jgi:hypothetical protein
MKALDLSGGGEDAPDEHAKVVQRPGPDVILLGVQEGEDLAWRDVAGREGGELAVEQPTDRSQTSGV